MQEYIETIQEAKTQEYKKQQINRQCKCCAVYTTIELTEFNLTEEMCLANLLSFPDCAIVLLIKLPGFG